MAGSIPIGSLVTDIKLNGAQPVKTLKELRQAVSGATAAWRAQETTMKAAGQATEAARAKFKGLSEAVRLQQNYIDNLVAKQKKLKQAQSEVDKTTEKGKQLYKNLSEEITKNAEQTLRATTHLERLTKQQNQAKSSLNYYESGLAEAQKTLKQTQDVTRSYVERLKAEGKGYESAKTKLTGYKDSLENLNKQQKIQEQELSRIASESGKSSEAYKRQEIRVNQTATSIAKLNTKVKATQLEVDKLNPKGLNRIANGAKHVTNAADKMKSGLKGAWEHVKAGATVAAAGIGAVGAAAISGAKKAGDLEQAYREITNLAVTGGEKQKEATEAVTQMQKQGRDMSIQYGKSQQDIAEAYEELVKRGYTTKQALGAMRTELQGSVASGDDFKDVVAVSSTTLESFGMRAETTAKMTANTKRAVNELAYAADMTSTGFKDLGYGMSYVGSSAHQAGFSLSETASAMGILSNNGLEASKAGTGLNQVINRLSSSAAELAKGAKNNVLAKMGISPKEIMNSKGQLKDLSTVFGVLNDHMKGMSKVKKIDMMKSLFGMTGEQAGLILAKYNQELGDLSKKTLAAGKSGKYVAELSEKNSQTAKMQMARLKQAGEALTMTMGAKMLPAINKAGNELVVFLTKSKDGKELTQTFANGVGTLSNALVKMIEWIAHHKTETKLIATGFGAAYGVVKLSQFVRWINNTRLAFEGLRTSSKIVDGLATSVGKLFTATKGSGKGLAGLMTPMRKAGGFKNLTTAGKVGTVAAGAGVAADVGTQFYKAFKNRHSADKRSVDIGKGIGAGIGGGIGLYFGGPLGAALGSKIGGFIGKWGGEGVNQFTKGWQRQGKKQKPQNWVQWLGFQAHNSLDFFVGLGKKAITAVGKGFNSAKSFAKRNSKELALTAVSPLIGIPTLLYKNNPKFKKWADSIGKNISNGFKSAKKGVTNFVKDSSKNIGNFNKTVGKKTDQAVKWFKKLPSNMHKGWKQGVEKSHKVMSKFWKDTGKGWNNFWKGVNSNRYVKAFKKGQFFQTAIKDMKSRWKSFSKDFGKKWKSTWKSTQKSAKNSWNGTVKNWNNTWKSLNSKWNSFKKSFSKSWSNAWKSFNSNRYVKAFKKGQFFQTALKDMKSRWNSFQKDLGGKWNSFWKSTQKWAKNSWDGTVKNWNNTWNSISKGWSSFKSDFSKGWSSFWDKLGDNVKAFGKTVKDDFIGSINNIIGGFNDVVHALGGGKKTVGYLKFADGTDWRKRYGTPAILNDGHDSPKTGNREGILNPDGSVEVVQGTNVKRWLWPWQDVINAHDMANIFGPAIHHANGTVKVAHSRFSSQNAKYIELQYKLAKKKYDEEKERREKKSRERSHKGQTLVDTGLLQGGKHRTGKAVWISTTEFKRLMSDLRKSLRKTKRKASKHRSKKKSTKRKSTKRRSSRRRSSTSTRRVKTIVSASVRGASSVKSLSALLRYVAGTHHASVKVNGVSGVSSIKSLKSAINGVTGKHTASLKFTYSGTYVGKKSIDRLLGSIDKLKKVKTVDLKVKYSGTYKAKLSFDRLTKSIKSTNSYFKSIKSSSNSAGKSLKELGSRVTSVHSRINSLYKALKKEKFGDAIKKQAEEAVSSLKGKGNFSAQFSKMTSKFSKDLANMAADSKKKFNSMWSAIKDSSKKGIDKIEHDFSSFKSSYSKGWDNLESGVKSTFNKFWNSMVNSAGKGVNSVIKVLNDAIGKIDSVVADFGGSKNAVSKVGYVKYATGTGYFSGQRRAITKPTLAMLNDGADSPETGNRETVWDTRTNQFYGINGTNVPMLLKPGMEVFNATESKQLGFTHFATGTGALKKLYETAKHYWNKPNQTGNSMFGQISSLTGAIKDVAKGMQSKAQHQSVDWWSQLWKMVEDKVNDDDTGPAKGLLKAVEKLGDGTKYSQARRYGPDSYDCSGLVSKAMNEYYHKNWGALTVAGLWPHAHEISKSEAKPGDPIFWLPNYHVGVYAGHGMYYSAFSPDAHPQVGMHSIASSVPGVKPTFARFNGTNTNGSNSEGEDVKVKANSHLQKQIKSQVGKGFWATIQKIQEKYGESDIPGTATPEQARRIIKHAMEIAGVSGNNWLHGLETIAAHESHFSNTVNNWDSNAKAGTPSAGWFQMIEPTFKAYAKAGYSRWRNPLDQGISAIRYIESKYGGINNVPGIVSLRHGGPYKGYANGGIATQASIFGEAGPEMAIPLIPSKSTRAWELIGKAVAILSNHSNFGDQQPQVNVKEQKEEHDFRQAVLLLLQEIRDKGQSFDIRLTTPQGRTLWEVVKPYEKADQRAQQIRERKGLSGRFR